MSKQQSTTAFSSSLVAVTLFFSAAYVASAAPDTWSSSPSSANWNTANWTGGNNPPVAGDALLFGSSSITTLNNNFPAGTAFDGIYFQGGNSFTLNGSSVLLSGAVSNTVGVQNVSGTAQTIGTLPLVLDWGYYTFSSFGSLALNGGLTANPGGVAYFDVNNTSTSLTQDATTGLITGLEGNGLMYDGNFTPTALATISGGTITAYSGATQLATPGAIASGNNVELTANGVAGTYTANNNTINALIADQAGNAGGTLTSTLTVTGTLTLGNQGGIYLLSGDNGNKTCLNVTGGTLTAGTSGPGTIVFAVNGNNANNQAQVASTIVNNAGSGAVTVVKTGPGSMNFATTTTSSYTGGVYVDQGQLQFGQLEQIGTGPAYVGVNGTLYYIGTGTITNNIFLSPGQGANVYGSSAVANGAGLILSGSSATIGVTGGTLNLTGAPVSSFPSGTVQTTTGDTISGNNSSGALSCFINCQVTGTGTLELTGAHSGTFKFQNASTVNTNNWQGGMIIGGHTGSPVNILVQMGATNQIPSGPGTGDISFNPGETGAGINANSRFDLNGFNTTVNALVGTAPDVLGEAYFTNSSSTPCTLTFGANNDSATFDGAFGDGGSAKALSLVKVGTGTQTLAGNMATDHGNVTVNGGTLTLTGGAASNTPANASVITVAAGATLDATGLPGGGLTIASTQTLNCVGQINGSTSISGTVEALDSIGTFSNNGGLTLNGGSTYVWDVNNFTGTQGGDTGWSLINVINGNSLTITATPGSQINLDITSLTSGDVPGSAANFNPAHSGSWTIATASGGISGFTGSSQFNIVTSGFANAPSSASQWSVSVSGNNLVLNYTAFNLITTSLTDTANNAGSTATFTVGSTTGIQPVTYAWSQNSTPLVNGSISGSGATVTITTNGPGTSSTLSIPNVQDADAGGISVSVNDNASHAGGSSAILTIIDPPTSGSVTQTGAIMDPGQTAFNSGGRTYLTANASGGINGVTPDFTYQWYLGTNAILGATNATLAVNISAATAGGYHVVITNPAGNTTATFSLSPVTSVANQMIFEPFDSYTPNIGFNQGSAVDTFSITSGHTNLFNQLTSEPAFWTVAGSLGNSQVAPNGLDNGSENQFGGEYPTHGLAGNSTNEFYWTTTTVNSQLRVTTNGTALFAPGGPNTNVFFSFTFSIVSLGSGASDGDQSVLGAFTTSAGASACGLEFWTWDVSGGASQVQVGVGKGNGTTVNNVTSGVNFSPANVLWSGPGVGPLGNGVWTQQAIFVVGCYNVVDGPGNSNDTVSLWINPPASSFNAATAPAPYLGPTSFGGTIANSVPQNFGLLNDYAPASHRITDLRIGTTWASVTPPAAPTFTLGNVYAPVGTTAVLASQNAGNPILNYGWQFNGGAPLTDGATGHGSTITGSSTGTLVISNIQSADFGLYTINGTNVAFTPSDNSATLTGSTTAIVSGQPPRLKVAHAGPDVIISWPTNWLGFVLEQTPSVSPTSWSTNSLPPYAVSGTNNAVTIPLSGNQEYYRLINP